MAVKLLAVPPAPARRATLAQQVAGIQERAFGHDQVRRELAAGRDYRPIAQEPRRAAAQNRLARGG
jgi:hypothetical protein